jgi:hypothetical protein
MRLIIAGQEADLTLQDKQLDGTLITASLPDEWGDLDGAALADIYVEVGGQQMRAAFVVPNEATQGGLE